uniref:Zinc finger protein n=1 Tax=Daphnia magna TaxID=35525 RepID=A0A0P6EU04_9CRUS
MFSKLQKSKMSKRIISKSSKGQKRSSSTFSNLLSMNTSGEEGEETHPRRGACPSKRTSAYLDQSRGETENPSLSRVKKKKSWTWLHFDEIENTKTCKCKYCPTTFVINGTGTMAKHMHSKHPAMIALASKHPSMIALDSKHPNMIDKPKQSPQNTKGKVTKSFKSDANNSAHKAFLEFVVTNNLAFTLGEEPLFQKFVSTLQPLYKPLSGTVLKDMLMQTYMKTRQQVIDRLSESSVALTTDVWISPNNVAFMVTGVAIWNERIKPINIIIGFKHVMGEHSGVNLAESFYNTVTFYQLNDNMLSITTDDATSSETFVDHIAYLSIDTSRPFKKDYWFRCFIHVINLCVKCAVEVMFELLQKLRDFIVEIRASPQRIQKFKTVVTECELESLDYEEDEIFCFEGAIIPDDLLPVLDCPKRWSSTYFFLKRGLRLKPAFDKIAEDQEFRKNLLGEEEWLSFRQMFSFLEEFTLVTTYIEANQHPTVSLVVPMCNRLLNLLEETSQDPSNHPLLVKGAAAGLLKLSAYYDKASPVVMAATFMDPRCKMQYFIDNGWSCGGETVDAFDGIEENLITSRVKPVIENVWSQYNVPDSPPSKHKHSTPKNENSTKANESAISTKSKINNSYFAQVVFGSSSQTSNRFEKDEMTEYEEEETEPADCDPMAVFDYWANRSARWPRLCAMAKDLLSIPATTAASERTFSACKDLFDFAGMNLNPEVAEALVCLRSWYRAGLVNDGDVHEFIEEKGDGHND